MQTETRALKAASENANTPFTRELEALYTATTWIDDLNTHPYAADTRAGEQTLLSVVEEFAGPNDKVSFAIVAVDVATANITYDAFRDGYLRGVRAHELPNAHGAGARDETRPPRPEGAHSHPRPQRPYYKGVEGVGGAERHAVCT